MGRLAPKSNQLTTMRDLIISGVTTQYGDGIKLLHDVIIYNFIFLSVSVLMLSLFVCQDDVEIKTPIHLEVTQASAKAISAIEKAGGTVTCVHLNRLALRALMKPYKFELLPRRARPSPRLMPYYLDYTRCGYLSPEIQQRNLRLFGNVTSEETYRAEHDQFMIGKRKLGLITYK